VVLAGEVIVVLVVDVWNALEGAPSSDRAARIDATKLYALVGTRVTRTGRFVMSPKS